MQMINLKHNRIYTHILATVLQDSYQNYWDKSQNYWDICPSS